MHIATTILSYFLLCIHMLDFSGSNLAEKRLSEHLLMNSSPYARPIDSSNGTVHAKLGLEYIQIVDLKDHDQLLTSKVWVTQTWKTDIFKWNESEWDGIKRIQMDASKIWKPDIVLYNNGGPLFSGGTVMYKTLINIASDGTCSWASPATFISSCDIDVREFPFDRQTCKLKFGSWTFDSKGINLTADSIPMITSQYQNSSELTIESAKAVVNSVKYSCCVNPFIDVTFELVLQRKPLYYIFNILVPCLLLVFSVLIGFFLPPESGERISLTITILLAVAVFLQLVSDALPTNSDHIPMIAVLYMVIMAESTLSLIPTCIVLVFHYRGLEPLSAPMPQWMRTVFLDNLARYMCIERHSLGKMEKDKSMDAIYNLVSNNYSEASYESTKTPDSNCYMNAAYKTCTGETVDLLENTKNINTAIMARILKESNVLSDKSQREEKQNAIQDDWRFLARILDRLCFWIFFVVVGITCFVVMLPSYFVNN